MDKGVGNTAAVKMRTESETNNFAKFRVCGVWLCVSLEHKRIWRLYVRPTAQQFFRSSI
jgi:hypothetical protein